MLSLHDLQRRVMHAVLDGDAEGAAALITPRSLAPGDIAPANRLNVYTVTARTNFTESLISSYPVVRRLVGEDYFAQCARGFHRRHPSVSGDLQPAGIGFAQYLVELHGSDDYRYLGEVARLEWLIQETLLAGGHPPFDLGKLGRVAPEDYGELRFQLHPTVRLFDSPYPCVHIWQANVQDDAEPELIDLSEGADRVLLMRSDGGRLTFHQLSIGEHAFLQALSAGERFEAAVTAGAAPRDDDGGFDAAASLQRFVLSGVIVDFQ
jgi:hypothetical protein